MTVSRMIRTIVGCFSGADPLVFPALRVTLVASSGLERSMADRSEEARTVGRVSLVAPGTFRFPEGDPEVRGEQG